MGSQGWPKKERLGHKTATLYEEAQKTYIVNHDSDNIHDIHEHSIISVGVNKNITLTLVSTVIIALGCPNYTSLSVARCLRWALQRLF